MSSASGSYREGDVRLVGGAFNWEGRVEIFLSGSWGTISDSSWTKNDANVICRQLQHSSMIGKTWPLFHTLQRTREIRAYFYTVGAIICCDKYEMGSGNVHLGDVSCVGSESHITQCNYTIVSSLEISHQQDVGVQCQQGIIVVA